MIGRNNKPDCPQHVVYFYTESHPAFGEWLKQDIRTYGLDLKPDYRPWDRPVGGSDNASFALYGIDRDEPLERVKAFAKQTGVTYPLGLDPGADIFALYAERNAGITRNVLIDKDGKIVLMTRLYNEDEIAALCKKIDELLK